MNTFIRRLLEPIRKNGNFDVKSAMRRGRIVHRVVDGTPVSWLITNATDEIQSKQLSEGYYELDELQRLCSDVGNCRSVLDVGANLGNHAVYFTKHLACRRLVCIEPFGPAYQHLLANLALNCTDGLDVRVINLAFGSEEVDGKIVPPTAYNIGLTKIAPSEGGPVKITRGDQLLGCSDFDLIKVDVEGMEVEVLQGLSGVIITRRPALYVEVSDSNFDQILGFASTWRYRLVRESRAYSTQRNLTLLPE